MFELDPWLTALGVLMAFGVAGWLISVVRSDVSIVDSMWSLMFLFAALAYISTVETIGPRAGVLLVMVFLWSVRLSAYISWRNHGEGEDYRYQQIRERNSPNFAIKSIYIVFGLQALLAWIISLPLLAGVTGLTKVGVIDYIGMALFLTGFTFESVGDWQLARFKSRDENKGRVLNTGFWKYTRHPNYFGDFCVWWGFYLLALSAGGWWTIVSPLLMTLLLLRVSGVALLEKDIADRRPEYADYVRRTNAFFPGPVSQTSGD